MKKTHQYSLLLSWTGNTGSGTTSYNGYSRDHSIEIKGKKTILCSSDPAFLGDKSRYNPEELFLASLANCHMLWYLHLCSVAGIIVTGYEDEPIGTMIENKDGSGQFTEVVLRPKIWIQEAEMVESAKALHHEANKKCFIANSVNFPVEHICEVEIDPKK